MTGLPGPRRGEPGRSARPVRRGGCRFRLRTMDEMRRVPRSRHRRQIGAGSRPRSCSSPRLAGVGIFRRPANGLRPAGLSYIGASKPISTRQYFRVEIAVSHSKQRIGVRVTRQFFGGSPSVIFKFAISNFEWPPPQKGVNQNQVFARASYSNQTSGAQKGCQFFVMSLAPSPASLVPEASSAYHRQPRRKPE